MMSAETLLFFGHHDSVHIGLPDSGRLHIGGIPYMSKMQINANHPAMNALTR